MKSNSSIKSVYLIPKIEEKSDVLAIPELNARLETKDAKYQNIEWSIRQINVDRAKCKRIENKEL